MFWCWVVSLVVVRSTMASLLLRGFLTMVPGSAVRMTATIITMSAAMDQKKTAEPSEQLEAVLDDNLQRQPFLQ